MNNNFFATFDYKLIYIFRINDKNHENMLKIGEATLHTSKDYTNFVPNCSELNKAAKKRINQYTTTAGIVYDLLYTEIAVFDEIQKDGSFKKKSFNDYKVHSVLKRSGIKNHYFDTENKQNEWFITDLNTAINAIKAVKNNQTALSGFQISQNINPIIFRPEQKIAITQTINQFKVSNRMLWNAKMRFGKTLTALQIVKELKFKKTIIITHRPAVDDGWFKDFNKIFYEKDTEYNYGSKNNGKTLKNLINIGKPFVYFASIQDLRGSVEVGGKYEKNDTIFSLNWDFVITDEAHEGTQTELGRKVREKLVNENNKELSLSGTPFNLFDQYSNDNTYTWDYIMEQASKESWMKSPLKLGDHNPYEELPKLNLFTYHLEKLIPNFIDFEDKAFNFKEFFRTWTGDKDKDYAQIPSGKNIGDFVHEDAVCAFLDLLCKKDEKTNYPFSTIEYRDYFRHTLWMVPGVKEGAALEKLLMKHSVFGCGEFKIVNVAGNSKKDFDDELKQEKNALDKLRKSIGDNPEETRTITISCGRLTTGVTVPEWTGVLMLAGTYATDAKQYLQTIFRVQSPANINGKIKENCYVFDFAPDRTLRVVYDAVKKMSYKRQPKITVPVLMSQFLNFCPVIASDDSQMISYKAEHLIQEIKRVYTERVVDSGFDDSRLYDDIAIKNSSIEFEKFEKLQKIIGKTNQTKKTGDLKFIENGLTDEQRKLLEELDIKAKKDEITPEEKKRRDDIRKIQEQKRTIISILRGISIRIPLLVYGIDKNIDYDITIDEFADMVDDESWTEFMPKGVTKQLFKEFIDYYDKDIFVASCRKIRSISKECDDLEPTERIRMLITLFNKFKNPDKETVLTPWNVVNMHMSETIGGYDFFDENHIKEALLDTPRFIEIEDTTSETLNDDSLILEINSKTGLYPLYIVYSLYRIKLDKLNESEKTKDKKIEIWDSIVENNIYIICKTEMAKMITKRTLVGYRNKKINSHAFDDLIMQFRNKSDKFVQKIQKSSFWNKGGNKIMKFNAVVGNPPYQGQSKEKLYPLFYLNAQKLGNVVSMIFPTGWQEPKTNRGLKSMNTMEVKQDSQIVFIDNRHNAFPGVSGAEWTNVVLWKKNYDNGLDGKQLIYTDGKDPKEILLPLEKTEIEKPKELNELFECVNNKKFNSLQSITSKSKPYMLMSDAYKKPAFYKLEPFFEERNNNTDILIYCKDKVRYVPHNYRFPRKTKAFDHYKVVIPFVWGNFSGGYLGGAYANIIVANPNEACTASYIESGCFDTKETAIKHAKYLMTKFFRALLYLDKYSIVCVSAFTKIPVQDYSEEWWDKSIDEIDKHLMDKYNVSESVRSFVFQNIQPKNESNIIIN